MKKTVFFFVCATICLTGCFSVDHSVSNITGEEYVLVSNYGWSLFGSIPVCCGNANENNILPWALFRDDVTMEKAQKRLMKYAENHGKSISNLLYYNNENILFTLPLTEISIPVPYFICYKEIQLSGVLK